MNDDVFDKYLDYIDFSESTESFWFASGTPISDGGRWDAEPDFSTKLHAFVHKNQIDEPSPLNPVLLSGNARLGAISARKEHFTRIIKDFHLPRCLVHVMLSNNGQLAHLIEYTDMNGTERPSALSIVMQTPHSAIKSFSLALRLSVPTNSATGILIVEERQDAAGIIKMLCARQDLIRLCPLYLLTIACEHVGYRNEKWRENLDLSLVQIEKHIGMSGFSRSALDGTAHSLNEETDYETIIRDLHILNTSLIWLSCTTNFEFTMLQNAASMMHLFGEMRGELRLPWVTRAGMESLAMQIRYLESSAQTRQNQRQGLQQRAETQIDILYSRISQRDSLLNMSIANSSRKIALVSRVDSGAVKTISVVTLFFLPATLVATICSTGIVEFQADVVVLSRYWWAFLAVVAALTGLVFAIWYMYMRRRRISDSLQFGDIEKSKSDKAK